MTKLRELMPFKAEMIESDGSHLRRGVLSKVGGVFQRAETKNANGRVYPLSLWEKILRDPDVTERIQKRQMVGMIGHPDSGITDAEKIALVVTKQELRQDNSIYGEAEVLDTPMGRIADTLIRAGVGLGISSRGDGSVEKKGEGDEVKDDFRLETYDFVLKPSTPGAYPGMLSECTVEEHEKLVAEAIGGLVNSKNVPVDQQIPVLTECLKILSVLEAKNSGNLVTTLSTKITEKLSETRKHQKVITSVVAEDELVDVVPNLTYESEDTMANTNGQVQITEANLAWHKQQVAEAVKSVQAKHVAESEKLKNDIVQANRRLSESQARLTAAEEVINEMSAKVRVMKEAAPSDKKLQRRYEAAVELLDEALKRLPEIGGMRRRNKTLESLVQAGFEHIGEERKQRAIKEHLSRVQPKFHATIRPVLEACKNPADVAKTFKAFVAISEGKQVETPAKRHDPLPSGNRGVNENTNRKRRVTESTTTRRPVQVNENAFANIVGKHLANI